MPQSSINKWIENNNVNDVLNLKILDIFNLPILPNNVKYLNISRNKLISIPDNYFPTSLEILICEVNNIRILDLSYLINLKQLNCSFNNIYNLQLPSNLELLNCTDNKISRLTLPSSLKNIECLDNIRIKFIIPSDSNLVNFIGDSDSQIILPNKTKINDNLLQEDTIIYEKDLDSDSEQVYEIIDDWEKGEDLDLTGLYLQNIPKLPDNVKTVYLSCNNISEELKLPDGIISLDLDYNNFKNIRNFPSDLKLLSCGNNLLTSISYIPLNLTSLNLSCNNLYEIPKLPVTLLELDINRNKISTLPILPKHLTELKCRFNNLSELPKLPDTLIYVDCRFNFFKKLPNNNSLTTLYIFTGNNLKKEDHILLDNKNIKHDFLEYEEHPEGMYNNINEIEDESESSEYDSSNESDSDSENMISTDDVSEHCSKLSLIDNDYSDKISNVCHNKENLLNEKLDTSRGNIIIIKKTDSKYIAYCYQYDEIYNTFNNQNPVYEWVLDKKRSEWKGEPDHNKRVYKEPYSNLWLDQQSRDYIDMYNTFIIKSTEKKRLGTGKENWESRMHGTDQDIHMIYKLYPIHLKKIISGEKIENNDIDNFIPEFEDLNRVYGLHSVNKNVIDFNNNMKIEIYNDIRKEKFGNRIYKTKLKKT